MATKVETWTKRLLLHATTGVLLDLRPDQGDSDLPDPHAKWPASRTIPAEAMVGALTHSATPLHRSGLKIRGARITGPIDLAFAIMPVGLELTECVVEDALELNDAAMPWLRMARSVLHSMDADRLQVRGTLSLSGSKLNAGHGVTLSLSGAQVGGSVFLNSNFEATGEIRCLAATISGSLVLSGAKITNPSGDSLSLDRTHIGGAFLDAGFEAHGKIRAHGATIVGPLVLSGAKLHNSQGVTLSLDTINVGGSTFLNEGFEAVGEVRALGATFSSQLVLSGAKIQGHEGRALSLDGAKIGGTAFLDNGFEADGEVRALGTTFVGPLHLSGSKLSNALGAALSLDSAHFGRGISLARGFESTGAVRLPGATVAGGLVLRGGTLSNPGRVALNLDGVAVSGTVVLAPGHLSGDITLVNSAFDGSTTISCANVPALSARPPSINARGSKFGWLNLSVTQSPGATFDFARTSILRLEIDSPDGLRMAGAAGWSLGTVHGELLSNRRAVVRMLDQLTDSRAKAFVSQPWKELADAIQRAGEPENARRLRWHAARRTSKTAAPLSRVFIRGPYGLVVGYGYYPLLTIAWLFGLWALVAGIAIYFVGDFVPTDWRLLQLIAENPTAAPSPLDVYPSFNPWLFALDTSLPVSSMGQAAAWRLEDHPLFNALFAGVKAASWALTALLVAGITGVLRKD